MRGKRSKQYRKLVHKFSLAFGFREPYQVLVDADMVKDASRFKMDLQAGLERTLHGKVKILITQCSIRHLYKQNTEPGVESVIELAKSFERRRCGHRPDEYPEPLSTVECLMSVIDPKQSGTNKHRYVVASQDDDFRRSLRRISGVPLIYLRRSVMIMEPMASDTADAILRDERSKLRSGLKKGPKRKREDEEEAAASSNIIGKIDEAPEPEKPPEKKRKRSYGLKGPNPLSVKKAKKKSPQEAKTARDKDSAERAAVSSESAEAHKPRRKRRHKTAAEWEFESTEKVHSSAAAADDG